MNKNNDKNKIKIIDLRSIIDNLKAEEYRSEKDDIFDNVKSAKKEWETAQSIFEYVTEPDLIDYAIHNVDATEKKYVYLIKKIKQGDID